MLDCMRLKGLSFVTLYFICQFVFDSSLVFDLISRPSTMFMFQLPVMVNECFNMIQPFIISVVLNVFII